MFEQITILWRMGAKFLAVEEGSYKYGKSMGINQEYCRINTGGHRQIYECPHSDMIYTRTP